MPKGEIVWLPDPGSHGITLLDVGREPTIHLIPECDTDEELVHALGELCAEIFEEHLAGNGLAQAGHEKLRGVLPMVRLPASLHAGRSL
jgi:hypothetical protein